MKTLAIIATTLLLSLGLLVSPASAEATDRDYESLTLEEAVSALRQADADLDVVRWDLTAAQNALTDIRPRVTYWQETAGYWETQTRATEQTVREWVSNLRAADALLARRYARLQHKDAVITRLRARLATARR